MTEGRKAEVVLAFDFGLRRIGVATGNLHTRTASPLTTLTVGRDTPWAALDDLVREWRPAHLVVGVPEGSTGPSAVAARARAFAAALARRYHLPVDTVDEAFTSSAAASDLRERRREGAPRRSAAKGAIDRRAACLIAEQWMNEAANER
ncbi:MAG TPA: Holliday junction resolvase RuvX [Gammaproteobacteria bacterium]